MTKLNIHVSKPLPIHFQEVIEAYRNAKRGGEASGVDGEVWEEFDKNKTANLYQIWNRLSSGTYFPLPVRIKTIPSNGKDRKLGIPAIRDRIAQHVLKASLEPKIEPIFSNSSYGYRPKRNCEQALRAARQNTFKYPWVVDLDISKFFDEIDHGLLMLAIATVVKENWLRMYLRRVLEAQEQTEDGALRSRKGLGTPQGGVVSPLLANLFLHYGLDIWMRLHYPQCPFERYADDMVVHCSSKEEAEKLMEALKGRLEAIKLRMNETKSKIVYCRDWKRAPQKDVCPAFDFLGYTFRPRLSKNMKDGSVFMVFTPEIKRDKQTKIHTEVKESVNWNNTGQRVEDIALKLNAKIRGWITYFGYFGKKQLMKTMSYIDNKLSCWMQKKHKVRSREKARQKLEEMKRDKPDLFYHWVVGMVYGKSYKVIRRAV